MRAAPAPEASRTIRSRQHRRPNGFARAHLACRQSIGRNDRRVGVYFPSGVVTASRVQPGPGADQATVGAPLGAGDYYWPSDVTTTPSGTVYVADGAYDIQRLDASGTPIARWSVGKSQGGSWARRAGSTPPGLGQPREQVRRDRGPAGPVRRHWSGGSSNAPYGISTDADGNLYVADANNNRVQKSTPAGAPLALFGSAGPGPGQLFLPSDVALDSAGNVYVANRLNDRIEKFSPTGAFLTAWGGTGSGDGPAQGSTRTRDRPRRPRVRLGSAQRPDPGVRSERAVHRPLGSTRHRSRRRPPIRPV